MRAWMRDADAASRCLGPGSWSTRAAPRAPLHFGDSCPAVLSRFSWISSPQQRRVECCTGAAEALLSRRRFERCDGGAVQAEIGRLLEAPVKGEKLTRWELADKMRGRGGEGGPEVQTAIP